MSPQSRSGIVRRVQCSLKCPSMSRRARRSGSLWTGRPMGAVEERAVSHGVISPLQAYDLADHMTAVESHLQNQKTAVAMLHERIKVIERYISQVLSGPGICRCASIESLICYD
jgi:hypothetical protein